MPFHSEDFDTDEFQFTRRGGGRRITPPRVIPRPRRKPPLPPRPQRTTGQGLTKEQESPMRPNDERGFIHKKLLKAVGGLGIPVVSTAAQIGSSFFNRGRPTPPRTATARVSPVTISQKQFGQDVKFGSEPLQFHDTGRNGRAPCDFPNVRDSQGRCRAPTSGEFGGPQFDPGVAVMGQYGAGQEPGSMIIDRAVCRRGMQLANDGLCYNKSQISNKQRMWPAGRKPLLTGGDMRAISTAARAGKRLEGATKRLQRMGMMKKPTTRRAGGGSHGRLLEAHVTK